MLLTVKDLVDYVWCPAKVWLKRNGPGLGWPVRHYSPEEKEEHDSLVEELAEKYIRESPGCSVERQPLLVSRALGLYGRPDLLVECEDSCIVVEVKTRRPGRHEMDPVQAMAYGAIALMGRCRGKNVKAVLAWPEGSMGVDVDIGRIVRLRRMVLRALAKPTPPAPRAPARACRACEYRLVCPYA